MIISTCLDCGREHTTHDFINSCEKCRGNIEVREIIEPRALSTETRLLIAEQKALIAIEAAHAADLRALDAYADNPNDHNAQASARATENYNNAEARLRDVRQALADLRRIEEIAGAA